MIKAEWTSTDALDLQPTCNQLATDCISRQAAIELAMQYCPDDDGTYSKAGADIRELLDELEDVPSAQPDIVEKILAAGKEGKEVRIYIGGRLFAVRELAQ